MKKATIGVPVYNREKYLREMLLSIEAQTYPNIEVIISDNCSTDSSLEIAKEFCDKNQWRLNVNDKNIGGIKNFHKLIDLATGDYVAIYHSDDVYHKDIVGESVKAFERDESIGLVTTWANFINEHSTIFSTSEVKFRTKQEFYSFDDCFKELSSVNFPFMTPSAMFKKEAFLVQGFRDKYGPALDYDMWFEMLRQYNLVVLNKHLMNYRIHHTQDSEERLRKYTGFPHFLMILEDIAEENKEKYFPMLVSHLPYYYLKLLLDKKNKEKQYTSWKHLTDVVKTKRWYSYLLYFLRNPI